MKRIAIVGSRGWGNKQAVIDLVRALPLGTVVVTGGARGVDSIAEEEALKCGLVVAVCRASFEQWGRAAGPVRNKIIVDLADEVFAFWDGKSPGTKNTIHHANQAGKKITICTQ